MNKEVSFGIAKLLKDKGYKDKVDCGTFNSPTEAYEAAIECVLKEIS